MKDMSKPFVQRSLFLQSDLLKDEEVIKFIPILK